MAIKVYDRIFPKKALDIYLYLFKPKQFLPLKEKRLKNLLYISIMYLVEAEQKNNISDFQKFWEDIASFDELEHLVTFNPQTSRFFYFYSTTLEIKEESARNEYHQYFNDLRQLILQINTLELETYLNLKQELDDLCDKIYYLEIKKSELETKKQRLEEIFSVLKKYLSEEMVNYYVDYIKTFDSPIKNAFSSIAVENIMRKGGKFSFSELAQVTDLIDLTKLSPELEKDFCDEIELTPVEQKNLLKANLKRLILNIMVELLILIIIIKFAIDTGIVSSNDTFISIIFFIILGTIMFLVNKPLVKNWQKRQKDKSKVIGFFAFIGIAQSKAKKENVYYKAYSTKYNRHIECRSDGITYLRSKVLYLYIKSGNNFQKIKVDEGRFR